MNTLEEPTVLVGGKASLRTAHAFLNILHALLRTRCPALFSSVLSQSMQSPTYLFGQKFARKAFKLVSYTRSKVHDSRLLPLSKLTKSAASGMSS